MYICEMRVLRKIEDNLRMKSIFTHVVRMSDDRVVKVIRKMDAGKEGDMKYGISLSLTC